MLVFTEKKKAKFNLKGEKVKLAITYKIFISFISWSFFCTLESYLGNTWSLQPAHHFIINIWNQLCMFCMLSAERNQGWAPSTLCMDVIPLSLMELCFIALLLDILLEFWNISDTEEKGSLFSSSRRRGSAILFGYLFSLLPLSSHFRLFHNGKNTLL